METYSHPTIKDLYQKALTLIGSDLPTELQIAAFAWLTLKTSALVSGSEGDLEKIQKQEGMAAYNLQATLEAVSNKQTTHTVH